MVMVAPFFALFYRESCTSLLHCQVWSVYMAWLAAIVPVTKPDIYAYHIYAHGCDMSCDVAQYFPEYKPHFEHQYT